MNSSKEKKKTTIKYCNEKGTIKNAISELRLINQKLGINPRFSEEIITRDNDSKCQKNC